MKKLIITVFSSIFALLFLAKNDALCAQTLPVPQVPRSQAGATFAPKIQNVQTLWTNKDFANMSKEVDALHDILHFTIDIFDRDATKEIIVLREWVLYFYALLPMVPEEKLLYSDFYFLEWAGFYNSVMQRSGGCFRIRCATRRRIAEVLQIPEKQIAKGHAAYFAVYLNFLLRVQGLAERGNRNQEKRTDIPQLIANDRFLYSDGNADWNRRVGREQIASLAQTMYDMYVKDYIRILQYTEYSTSNCADVMQNRLAKVGISSKIQMAIILEKAIGRSKETNRFFNGLPTQAQIQRHIDKEARTGFIKRAKEVFSSEQKEVRLAFKKDYDEILRRLNDEKVSAAQADEIWTDYWTKLREAKERVKTNEKKKR
jgi:hypothetical protein